MKNRNYKLIIFDCDGTLVDSERLTNRLIATMINERSIAIDEKVSLHLFAGKTLGHITKYIVERGVRIDEQKFEDEYRERCMHLFNSELRAIKGAEELLQSLPIPFCVASNGPKKKMKITLPASGLSKYFKDENTFSAYDIGHWKPEPQLFRYAAEQMDVGLQNCLVIEDTWSGVMGAVNGGIDVIGYNPHNDSRMFVGNVPNYSSMADIQGEVLKRVN